MRLTRTERDLIQHAVKVESDAAVLNDLIVAVAAHCGSASGRDSDSDDA